MQSERQNQQADVTFIRIDYKFSKDTNLPIVSSLHPSGFVRVHVILPWLKEVAILDCASLLDKKQKHNNKSKRQNTVAP